jgi:ATP-binding protein involved in chromosome partitioning
MMAKITRDLVLEALKKVKGPDLEGDVVSLGLVSEIAIDGERVMFSLSVDPNRAAELEPWRQAAEQAVLELDGVGSAMVALTAERQAGGGSPARAGNGSGPTLTPSTPKTGGAPPPGPGAVPPPQAGGGPPKAAGVPGVKSIIAVASGKGGVGKSTTAVNLALGLKANGLEVGVLDADIYGPSMPRLLGITGRPQPVKGKILKPMQGFGLKVMSMGFLVEEDTPMIWRGPMVISALTQMLREVDWGELDVLVVDMPPGTGDAQLTMAQQVPLAGAVIVSTPQDLALIDARKGLNMFRRVDVPVLGIVENMSYFTCPHCGEKSDIFGHGGARAEAENLGVAFLGEVPLDIEVRKRSDEGQPIVVSNPDSAHAKIYRKIADQVSAEITRQAQSETRSAPKIVME